MVDLVDKATRSRMMSGIRGRNVIGRPLRHGDCHAEPLYRSMEENRYISDGLFETRSANGGSDIEGTAKREHEAHPLEGH